MYTSTPNLPQKTLKVKKQNHDEKPFSKNNLETQISMANLSTENDDGGSKVGVPFLWESQPGTPKLKNFRENISLPPLTPPPSYFYNTKPKTPNKSKSNKLLSNFFSKYTSSRKSRLPASPASSSSSSSSSSSQFSTRVSCSVPSSPFKVSKSRITSGSVGYGISTCPRRSLDSSRIMVDEEECECSSPVSTLCFAGNGRSAGCYASMIKVLIA